MTNVPNRHDSRSESSPRSSHGNRSCSRSTNRSHHSEYSPYKHSRSHSRSASGSRSRSRSIYSRSRSRSCSNRSGSWSRSRSRSKSRYSSRSRSHTRSRSRYSYHEGRRRSYLLSRSRSRSRTSVRSRSATRSSASPPSGKQSIGKDPRDRSKRVSWRNSIWLVGEKAKDVVFHFCDTCDLPIVIYGRLLPCKHVHCYTCAMNLPNKCSRCQKSVQTVERCLVGGIFMCFENDSCRRTYLSQRDLQAHIDHRHRGGITVPPKSSVESSVATQPIKVALSKPITETSGSTLTSTKTGTNTTPVHKDAASLFQSLQRQCNLSVMSSSSTSLPTVGFGTGSKSKGLLPLPTPTSVSLSGLTPRISVSHSIPPPPLGPFPQMMQFSTPPPPIGSRSLVPPSTAVLNPSVPPPSAVRNPSFNAANAAVVALAAAAAAMNTQSKAAGMPIRPDALLSGHPGISGTGHLQPGGLNLSMFSNALLSNQTSWSQANAMGNFTNRLPQPNSAPNSSTGPMNIGRFPF
ncbi:E3 ubiquitin-protein ligase Hakai [Paragonimus westermani]|uniref:E3 ubiquitin-protein ligase Hakai n=1 Tax=Paragonimus westermani TaxID=34504 RepID=A0A8T0DWV6_9TREM|nr:E3 ubiquitin-protein ligase Hakai [Paragonimus westermani]